MHDGERRMMDGNEATARVAYRLSEVIAIYPITPASPMGELCDVWSVHKEQNLWGSVPDVAEMQSEGGAAGAVHGALQGGALTTTFTASQGLLLMLPNLYKIAGELTSCCVHVAARTVATHALSIFGDHSDVMAARGTGFSLLCSGSPQEAHDLAAVGHAATLRGRVPVLHFFDGFRTSHEIGVVNTLSDDDLRALIDDDDVAAHKGRALTPDAPVVRGTAQNPDVFFQAREAVNGFYDAFPAVVQDLFDRLHERTGRRYRLFEYAGHPEAERVVVLMGSGSGAAGEAVEKLAAAGEKVGAVTVRLYRPFDAAALLAALPDTVRSVAVLDRTKEPGAPGEPLFLDVAAAAAQRTPRPLVVGGRYGLGGKELTPAGAKAVLDELSAKEPRHDFTVGVRDDVTGRSLSVDESFDTERDDTVRAVFYGLGSDGTVGANKSSIKIIGEAAGKEAQGFFVYDSKKSGAVTVSHLRFGPDPIRSTYLIQHASFVAVHRLSLLDRFDVLDRLAPGGTLLLNAPGGAAAAWDRLPREVQQAIVDKRAAVWAIDAARVARDAGLGVRINTIMQACFFALSGVLEHDEAVARIKESVEKMYGKRGPVVVRMNHAAIDAALGHLERVDVPDAAEAARTRPPPVPAEAPDFVQRVTGAILAGRGDTLPVSAFPVDGTWPVATSQWERRGIAQEVPVWDADLCIQCNQCVLQCPHATIRAKAWSEGDAPDDAVPHAPYRGKELRGQRYTLQVAPDDCTGCHVCFEVCPAKDKSNPRRRALEMVPREDVLERERARWSAFQRLPELDAERLTQLDARQTQQLRPLFEFSGACAGCGETPYLKLLTQLFGTRAVIANATGCSSIYGGNLPTTPYCTDDEGRGPAWSNSLFEDNAEFGFGMRLAFSQQGLSRSVWLVGGDGWAYDIGYGGLDHVLSSGRDVNVLVLDTEAYSNTGGQQSKATPLGASAKFAMGGKETPKKDLGLEAMSYGSVYVARVALGAKPNQTVRAFVEAESWPGPSLIIAYSPCIAHGYDLRYGPEHQKKLVSSGIWPLYRFDPRRTDQGEPPLVLDSGAPTTSVADYMRSETRFAMVEREDAARFQGFLARASEQVRQRYAVYLQLAGVTVPRAERAAEGEG